MMPVSDLSQWVVSIDAQRQGEQVLIRPHLDNAQPLTLRYRMSVEQSGSAGTANISQGGELRSGVAANAVSLSVPRGARCRVHLEVFAPDDSVQTVERDCDAP